MALVMDSGAGLGYISKDVSESIGPGSSIPIGISEKYRYRKSSGRKGSEPPPIIIKCRLPG
jgi:hypothetical protein